jgi:uncharacterized protein (TIGR02099 family)
MKFREMMLKILRRKFLLTIQLVIMGLTLYGAILLISPVRAAPPVPKNTQIITLLHWILQQQELTLDIPSLTWLAAANKPISLQHITLSLQHHQAVQKMTIQADLLDSANQSQQFRFEGNILNYNQSLTTIKIQFMLTLPLLNFNGVIELDTSQNRVKIQQATLLFTHQHWSHPLKLEKLQADWQWQYHDNQWIMIINQLSAIEQTLQIQVAGKITVPVATQAAHQPTQVPVVDLKLQLHHGQVNQLYRYIPDKLLPTTVKWFKKALLSGSFKTAELKIHGAMNQLLDKKNLQLNMVLEKVRLNYADAWPPIENLTTSLQMQGRTITLVAQKASIYHSQLTQAVATIKDITADEPALDFVGELTSSGEDSIKFIQNSPLHKDIDVGKGKLEVAGKVKLQLKMRIPFSPAPNTIFVKILFEKSIINDDSLKLKLTDVSGALYFDGTHLASDTLHGTLSDTPLDFTISILPQAEHEKIILVSLSGQVDSHFIYEQMRNVSLEFENWQHIYKHLLGTMRLQGTVRVFKTQNPETSRTDIYLHSDMQGMTLDFPPPLSKTAAQLLPFQVHASLPKQGDTVVRVSFAKTLSTTLSFAKGLARGIIALGTDTPVDLPDTAVLHLSGQTPELAWRAWQQTLFGDQIKVPQNEDDKFPVPFLIDLKTDHLDVFGQIFNAVSLKAKLIDEVWHVALQGEGIDGNILFDKTQQKPLANLVFKNLIIPPQADVSPDIAAQREQNEPKDTTDPRELPIFTFHADNLQLGKMALGNVNLYTHPTPEGIFIELLEAKHDGLNLAAKGEWKYVSNQQNTYMSLWLDSKNIPLFLQKLGFPSSPISEGNAQIEIDVRWADTPYRVKLSKLIGKLRFLLTEGQIVDVDPGVGRVIGLFDLQVLPKRIMFDFNDIFSKGFAFATIIGEFALQQGLAHTDHVIIQAPAARIEIKGDTDLVKKQYNQIVNVFPHVSNTLPIAGALVGGLGVGAVAIIIQQLIQGEIEKNVNYQYRVTGSWDKPLIESVSIPADAPKHND